MYTRGLVNLVLLYGQTPSTVYIEGTNRRRFDKCVAFVEKLVNSC